MKKFFTLFFLQILSYGILCVNYRAVAVANIPMSALTDAMIASLSFFVIKRIAQSEDSVVEWAGYTLGSVVGSVVGIWLSTYILGK